MLKQRNGLPNFFKKLKDGENICVGYLGGSITRAEGYRCLVQKWLKKEFPGSGISSINAGIGGTGSVLGVFRVEKDILEGNPDLVFVEFAVNDSENTPEEWSMSAMEGIVRKILTRNLKTEICFIYAINRPIREALMRGELYWTVESMEKLAEHYGIPSINLGIEIMRLEKESRLVYAAPRNSDKEKEAKQQGKMIFSYDGTHPTLDEGHRIYSELIAGCLAKMEKICLKERTRKIPSPAGKSPWTDAKLIPFSSVNPGPEWQKVNPKEEGLENVVNIHRLEPLYKASSPGAEISFRFRGRGFGIFCVFGLNSGRLKVDIDGCEKEPFPLLDKYGNRYRVHYKLITADLEDGEHEARITLDGEPTDKQIISVERPVANPEKLEGIVCYAGGILMLGNLLQPLVNYKPIS